jgi:hypothetical protein
MYSSVEIRRFAYWWYDIIGLAEDMRGCTFEIFIPLP